MQEFLNTYFGNVMAKLPDFYGSILDTLRMTGRAGAIALSLIHISEPTRP